MAFFFNLRLTSSTYLMQAQRVIVAHDLTQ